MPKKRPASKGKVSAGFDLTNEYAGAFIEVAKRFDDFDASLVGEIKARFDGEVEAGLKVRFEW